MADDKYAMIRVRTETRDTIALLAKLDGISIIEETERLADAELARRVSQPNSYAVEEAMAFGAVLEEGAMVFCNSEGEG